jgi:hypothetical protein
MISEKFATEQVRRLQSLKFFPTDKVAVKELASALRSAADTELIASNAIDELTSTLTDCPVPADIRRAVFAKADDEEYKLPYDPPAPGTLCPICRSNGTIQEGTQRVRCTCRNGQEFPQGLLDMMNAPNKGSCQGPIGPRPKRSFVGRSDAKPITQAEIDAALKARGR